MRRAAAKQNETLFLVHRDELFSQTKNTLNRLNVSGDYAKTGKILTVGNRLEQYNPKILIEDECNFALAKSWRKVINNYPKAYNIGLSGTPIRLDGTPMNDIYDYLIQPITVKELIKQGLLSPYKYYSINHNSIDFSKLKKRAGDYKPEDIYEIMGREVVCDNVIENFIKFAKNKQTIVFCSTVKHSLEMTERFKNEGFKAECISEKTSKKERPLIVERFKTGITQILVNVDICTYGFDSPSCECVVELRKTDSYPIYHQSVMRCMRPYPEKTALILDFVSNVTTHGLPDTDIEWTLEGRAQKQANEIKIKTCPQCYAVLEQDTLICPYCSCDFTTEVRERKEQERITAELIEITERETQRLRDLPISAVKEFTTWEQLNEYRQVKKFHIMWGIRKALQYGIYIPEKYNKLKGMIK